MPDTGALAATDPAVRSAGERLVHLVAEFFADAGDHPVIGRRIVGADTTFQAHFTDAEPLGYTLHLNGDHVRVDEHTNSPAEIEIWGTVEKMQEVWTGKQHLAMAIARGDVEYSGPVRKFLRILPIIGALAREKGIKAKSGKGDGGPSTNGPAAS